MEEKRVNGDVDVSKKSTVPSRYHHVMTSEDEAHSQSSSASSSDTEEEKEEEEKTRVKSISSSQSVSPVPGYIKSEALAPAKGPSQVLN